MSLDTKTSIQHSLSTLEEKPSTGLFFLVIVLISTLMLSAACTHTQITHFDPSSLKSTNAKPVLFGFIKINKDNEDVTEDALISLSNGLQVQTNSDGFIVFETFSGSGSIKVSKITLSSGAEYDMKNGIAFRVGPNDSKTYFGHIQMSIITPAKYEKKTNLQYEQFSLDAERWAWKVTNKWKEAWSYWSKKFGRDQKKSYGALAIKLNREKFQSRSIATDRQAVETGF